jgi:hypothetical protein
MNPSHACSEAEWMLETIVDDFALSLELSDRARFYARLVELLIEQRDRVQRVLDGTDSSPDSWEQLH